MLLVFYGAPVSLNRFKQASHTVFDGLNSLTLPNWAREDSVKKNKCGLIEIGMSKEAQMIEGTASFYPSLTVLISAVVFVAGMFLIPYGISLALIAILLTVLGITYAKKLEEEFYVHDTKEGVKDG
jgi:hypothetical protein